MSSDGHATPDSRKGTRGRSQSFRLERPTFADNVKKSFSRAKARVSRKFGKSDRTRDEFLLQFESHFLKQQEHILKLQRTFKYYATNVRAIALAYQQVQDAMMDTYDNSWVNRKECGDALQKMMEYWLSYVSVLSNKVRNPLSDYALLSIDVKGKLSRRNKKLMEYDISRKVLEDARSNKKSPEDLKLYKDIEEDFREAKAAYDDITNELYNELPAYQDKRIQTFTETWELFFVASETLHRELAQQCRVIVESIKDLQLKALQGQYRLQHPDDEPHPHAVMTMRLDQQSDGRKSSSLSLDDDSSNTAGGYGSKYSSVRGSLDAFEEKPAEGDNKREDSMNGDTRPYKLRSNSLINVNVGKNTSLERLVPKVIDKRQRYAPPPLVSSIAAPRVSISSTTSGGLRPLKVLPHSTSLDKEKSLAREYPTHATHASGESHLKNKSYEHVEGNIPPEDRLNKTSPAAIGGEPKKKSHLSLFRGGLGFNKSKEKEVVLPTLSDDSPTQIMTHSDNKSSSNNLKNENGLDIHGKTTSNLSTPISQHESTNSTNTSSTSPSSSLLFVSPTSPVNPVNKSLDHHSPSFTPATSLNPYSKEMEVSEDHSVCSSHHHRNKRKLSRRDATTVDDAIDSRANGDVKLNDSTFVRYTEPCLPPSPRSPLSNTNTNHFSDDKVGSEIYSNGKSNESNLIVDDVAHKVVVRFAYSPQDDDELSLLVGDVLQIIPWEDEELKEDGWEFGLHLSSRRRGLFPLNHTAPYMEFSNRQ